MKKKMKYVVLLFCFCLIVPALLTAQNKFEGKVNIKITQDGESTVIGYYLKDSKIRYEMGDDISQFSIIDADNEKIYLVMPDTKMIMEIPAHGIFSPVENTTSDIGAVKIHPTGEAREINGYLCEKWIYNGEQGVTESWLALDFGGFVFMDSPMGEMKSEWQTEIESSGYFPMLIINRNKEGKEESRYEVISVEERALSSDFFNPPAGYQRMEMPGIK